MDTAQLLVTLGGAALIVAVLVFFFGPKKPRVSGRDTRGTA
jgi:hypothetical protein